MQNCAIVLGGLESSYMRKLALYLQERLDSHIQVEIVDKNQEQIHQQDGIRTVLVGSESFVESMSKNGVLENKIILDEEGIEDEQHVFRYRSCERLYRDISRRCQRLGLYPYAGAKSRKQKWIAVTTDGMVGTLLAFSVSCAHILGERERVLYVNLSECCGMRQLFDLEPEFDLSDLFLDLRKRNDVLPESYAERIGSFDYLLPTDNPMILHEIGQEDMNRFLTAVHKSGKYDCVVFAVGTTFCGCEEIFKDSSRIIHLTGQGLVNACAREAWIKFIRQCIGETEEVMIKQVPVPEIRADDYGEHIIGDWMEEPIGKLARSCLEREEGEEHDRPLDGN